MNSKLNMNKINTNNNNNINNNNNHNYQLNSPLSPSAAAGGKPRCWACWEPQTNSSNPLIRGCGQCKGSDMKLIHHYCLQSYLSNLIINRYQQVLGFRHPESPLALSPAWLFDSWLAKGVRKQWFLDEAIMQWLVWSIEHYYVSTGVDASTGVEDGEITQSIATSPIKESLNSPLRHRQPSFFDGENPHNNHGNVDNDNNYNDNDDNDMDNNQNDPEELKIPPPPPQQPIPERREFLHDWTVSERWKRGQVIDLRPLGLHCSRCLDRYVVYAVPAPVFRVLRSDPIIRLVMILAALGISLFTFSWWTVIYGSWTGLTDWNIYPPLKIGFGGYVLFSFSPLYLVSGTGLALIFISFVAVGMLIGMTRFASGQWQLICIQKPEVRHRGCQ